LGEAAKTQEIWNGWRLRNQREAQWRRVPLGRREKWMIAFGLFLAAASWFLIIAEVYVILADRPYQGFGSVTSRGHRHLKGAPMLDASAKDARSTRSKGETDSMKSTRMTGEVKMQKQGK